MTRKPARVNLPRPTKRARARTSLTINMHPDQLAELRARAESRGMSLTAYLGALLDSDADDVAPERRRFFSWGELTSPASLVAAGVHRDLEVRDIAAARDVARALGAPLADDDCSICDKNPCECRYPLLPGYTAGKPCAHCQRPAPAHEAACAFVVTGRVKRLAKAAS